MSNETLFTVAKWAHDYEGLALFGLGFCVSGLLCINWHAIKGIIK